MKNTTFSQLGQNTGRNYFTTDFPTHQVIQQDIDNSLRIIKTSIYAVLFCLAGTALLILNAGL